MASRSLPTDITLAAREAEVMNILWRHGPSTVSEVRRRLHDRLAYTTVLTILRTLEAKRYVDHVELGRAHRYAARVAAGAARESALRALTRKLFHGSMELLLTHLVSDRSLTGAEIRRMRRILAGDSRGVGKP
jgi:predicted transcriptional regulator